MEDIKLLYNNILLREPDEEGLKFYYNKLSNEADSLDNIKNYLYDSGEYKEKKKIIDIYLKYLFRSKDKKGILNYYKKYKNNIINLEEIEKIIKTSNEANIKNKIIDKLKEFNIKINNNALHKIYNLYDKNNDPISIYQNFLNKKIKEIIHEKFIYYDPNSNNIGHYKLMKNCIRKVIDINYFNNIKDLKKILFMENTLYIFYIYSINKEVELKNFIDFVKIYGNFNIKFYINIWNEDTFKLLKKINGLNNVNLICDINFNYIKKKILISPPILDRSICFKNSSNKISNYIKKRFKNYVICWTFIKSNYNSNRWIKKNNILSIRNILSKIKIKLVIINLTEELNDNKIYEENDIIYIDNKIKCKNDYLNLCKNSKYCLIISNQIFNNNNINYYNFRSSGRLTDLINNKVNVVTDFNIEEKNIISCNYVIQIKNIKELKRLRFHYNKESNLKFTTWFNYNFKKIIDFTNYSIKKNTFEIDILGNSNTLKNYNFKSNNIKIGMNVAYRYWIKNNVYPNIYISLDKVVTKCHSKNIHNLILNSPIEIFILDDIYFEDFHDDIYRNNVYNFNLLKTTFYLLNNTHITTGIFAVRCVIMMGFKYLNVYGMEGNYINFIPQSEKINSNNKIILRIKDVVNKNPNYFFDYYQQVGDLYNIPNHNCKYRCNCDFHKNEFVDKPLHKYVWELLFFDLKKYNINYKFKNYKLEILNINI